MQNTEYNTYQQYQRSREMKKIFSLLRTDHVALLNILLGKTMGRFLALMDKKLFPQKYF